MTSHSNTNDQDAKPKKKICCACPETKVRFLRVLTEDRDVFESDVQTREPRGPLLDSVSHILWPRLLHEHSLLVKKILLTRPRRASATIALPSTDPNRLSARS